MEVRPEPSGFMRINSAATGLRSPNPKLGALCKYTSHGPVSESGSVGSRISGEAVVVTAATHGVEVKVDVGAVAAVDGFPVRVGAPPVTMRAGVCVDLTVVVSVRVITVFAGAHDARVSETNNMIWMLVTFMVTLFGEKLPNSLSDKC